MIQVKLTPAQFAAKCAQLKADHGVEISGESGTIDHGGFAASYFYDGTTLAIVLNHHPFFMSESTCESYLLAWFAGS